MEYLIDVPRREKREEFVKLLEGKRYKIVQFSREEILSNIFPLVIDSNKKTICMMGNVTTAAAATKI